MNTQEPKTIIFTPSMDIGDGDWMLEIRPMQKETMIYDLAVISNALGETPVDESNPNKRYGTPSECFSHGTHVYCKRELKDWEIHMQFEVIEEYSSKAHVRWIQNLMPSPDMIFSKDFCINNSQLVEMDKKFHNIVVCGEHKVIKYVILDGVKHCKGDDNNVDLF